MDANLKMGKPAVTPKPDEWDVRGHLAASLTFWHRLKGEEADELVAALQSWATPAQPAPQGAAYAEPEFKMGRGYIERSIGGVAYREGWVDALEALRASHGQAPAGAAPDEQMIAEYGIKASRMMARDLTRFDAACEVDKYLREQGAPGYYRHRMSIILFGNVEGTEASRSPENSEPAPTAQAAPAAGAWIERWHGSGGKDGYEGWSIVNQEGRGLVAYLGRNVESGAVTEIVMAHNATLASPTAQVAQVAPAGTTLPEGWVSLTITHEGQHTEEIAYGPQRMMDRLGKWLCKYFAKTAAPAQMPDLQPLHNLLYLAQRQNALGAMRCAVTEARLELAKVRDAVATPTVQFEDPKVQIVYAILCENAKPPEGEHWEGFAARRIVDALFKESVRDGQNH